MPLISLAYTSRVVFFSAFTHSFISHPSNLVNDGHFLPPDDSSEERRVSAANGLKRWKARGKKMLRRATHSRRLDGGMLCLLSELSSRKMSGAAPRIFNFYVFYLVPRLRSCSMFFYLPIQSPCALFVFFFFFAICLHSCLCVISWMTRSLSEVTQGRLTPTASCG